MVIQQQPDAWGEETNRDVPHCVGWRLYYAPENAAEAVGLEDLADSIRAQGVVQPILVRPIDGSHYEIIAGERRWRAAQLADLQDVPVMVREMDDRTTIAVALIENIQRENLNPLEEAHALQRLIDEFEMTHQQAAEAVGRSRTAVSNLLRLLELGEVVTVAEGQIRSNIDAILDPGSRITGHINL